MITKSDPKVSFPPYFDRGESNKFTLKPTRYVILVTYSEILDQKVYLGDLGLFSHISDTANRMAPSSIQSELETALTMIGNGIS